MKVCKFGGTSVASANQIKKVVEIVKSDPKRKIIVVSAPGKRFDEDEKVTDLLISLADAALNKGDVESALENVVLRYQIIAEELGLDAKIGEVIQKIWRNDYKQQKKMRVYSSIRLKQLEKIITQNLLRLISTILAYLQNTHVQKRQAYSLTNVLHVFRRYQKAMTNWKS